MAQTRFHTLVDIYDAAIKQFPTRELFGTKRGGTWQWTTYAEFGKDVERLRGGLASLGVKRGDKIAIISNNRVEWAVFAYAAFGLGAAFVPMYEAQLDKDWEFIARDCDAKILVAATEPIFDKCKPFLKSISSLEHIVCLEGGKSLITDQTSTYASLLESGRKEPSITPHTEDIACFIYTSGTTGNPKGVILSHHNIASNVSAVHELFPISVDDRSLSFLPWAHSFGQTCELHALLSSGASMALCEAVDKIIDNLAETKPTLLFSVPRIFNKIYTSVQKQIAAKPKPVQRMVAAALKVAGKKRDGGHVGLADRALFALADKLVFAKVRARFGGRLKYAFSGGAAISREVAEFIDGLGITVYEGYGLTETSPISTANWPNNRRIGSVGKAIPGVRIEIDPTNGGGEKNGFKEGEIVVFGPNVMVGYHNRPEENVAVFTKDRGFRTGDMGYVDTSGFVFITGRIKEQYKLENGKYVVPTPLEEQLKLSPYIANAMVYGDNKPFNVALIVANMGAVKEWASANGASDGRSAAQPGQHLDDESVLASAKVRELFKGEVEQYSGKFKGFESVSTFALIPHDFTTENGMLTPSLKLKRRKVMEAYGPLIEGLYAKKASAGGAAPTAGKPARAASSGA